MNKILFYKFDLKEFVHLELGVIQQSGFIAWCFENFIWKKPVMREDATCYLKLRFLFPLMREATTKESWIQRFQRETKYNLIVFTLSPILTCLFPI